MQILTLIWTDESYHLLVAAGLGLIIGLEREFSGKDPGIRTFSLICLGSCIFSMVSIHSALGVPGAEPSRIAAQIVPGIGFLGAGAIFKSRGGVAGLTTAALMWLTASVGMAVGFGLIPLAVSTTVLTLIIVVGIGLLRNLYRTNKDPEQKR